MCRITVFVPKTNNLTKNHLIPFLDVMELNGNSNKDGFGLSLLNKSESTIFKKSEEASKILIESEVYDYLSNFSGQNILGHTRIATVGKGKNNDKNAHPFEHGSIIGVHNGHFSNYLEIKKKYNIPDEIEVDSDVFFYRLSMIANGQELTFKHIQDCVDEFTGTFAICIYDKIGDRIWVIPAQNDLYLYDLGYAWLINTSNTIDTVLKYSLNRLNFITGEDYSVLSEQKIKNKAAFTIDSNGLVEVHEIKVAVPTYTYLAHTSNTSTNSTNLNCGDAYKCLRIKQVLLNKHKFSDRALIDLVENLPEEFQSYYALTTESLKLLDEFLVWLEGILPLENIEEMCSIWNAIYSNTQKEYEYCKMYVPDFQSPFWLNDLETLKSIPLPQEDAE